MPEIHIGAGPRTDEMIQAGLVLGFYRQCSIGYHDECSDPNGAECKCPCHVFSELLDSGVISTPILVKVTESVWVNPDQVIAVRDRGHGDKSESGPHTEILSGTTGFVVKDEAENVVRRLNGESFE